MINMIETQETAEPNWLSLKPAESTATRPFPSKTFCCRFCGRKFYSPQALGGHQNAHRRERGLVRSLSIRPHALPRKPGRERAAADGSTQDFAWPGSYYSEADDCEETMVLDLNLKL